MRLSKSGVGITKLENLDELFPAQDILIKSGQLFQYASGVFGLNSIPYKTRLNIEKLIRNTLDRYNAVEVILPTIQPKSIWDKSGRYDSYVEEGTMMTTETAHGEFCLAPTAEEAIIEFAKPLLPSYKSLPITFYQIGEKYRNEIRNRGYMFRGKAFTMFDAYSFNENPESLKQTYDIIKKAYKDIFDTFSLPVIPVAADSGAIGGSKSEEYMLISNQGEDTILFNKETGLGLNTEVLEFDNYETILKEEYGIDNLDGFEEVKAIELGHIFQLGDIYSKSMEAVFTDKDEKQKYFQMGCYGIGVSRLLATIYEYFVLKDDNNNIDGINLPISIAPYLMQIVYHSKNEEKAKQANKLYEKLNDLNIPSIIDDRDDKKITFGIKINQTKILGTPFICILGNKSEKDEIELEYVKTGEKFFIKIDKLLEIMTNLNSDRSYDWKKDLN